MNDYQPHGLNVFLVLFVTFFISFLICWLIFAYCF